MTPPNPRSYWLADATASEASAPAALALRSNVDLAWPANRDHLGKPWFLPAVGAWYKPEDRLR